MNATKPIQNLKSKSFNKVNTVAMSIVLLAILIIVNMTVERLPWKYDMTFEKIFSLSDQTIKVLSNLDKEINVVAFYQEGKEDSTVKALLDEYVNATKGKIKVDYVDAEKNPIVAKRYDTKNEGITNENIVFECSGNIKKVNSVDIYTLNNAYGKSFNGEQQFTGAILYVSSPKLSKVYFIEGNDEAKLDEDLFKLKGKIITEASNVESLNLVKSGKVPEDADVIVVASPKRDISAQEKEILKGYLGKGGRAIFLYDVLSPEATLPNFSEVLKAYGIGIDNNFVVEEDKNSFYSNNNMYIVPNYTEHSIAESLNSENLAIIMPYALNLKLLNSQDKNLILEPVLTTSKKSWIRYNVLDASASKTDKDIVGPANLAIAVTKDNTDDRARDTKIVVFGNAKFIENSMLDIQGNIDVFMNALNWVQDKKDAISIRSKMLNSNQMMVTGAGYIILLILSVFIIPMLAFGSGLIVWFRRRHS